MDLLGNHELPIGLGMELAKNTHAMDAFSAMPEQKRQEVIETAKNVHSKREMEQFVNSLSNPQNKTF